MDKFQDNVVNEREKKILLSMGFFSLESLNNYGWDYVWRVMRVKQLSKRDKLKIFDIANNISQSMRYCFSCLPLNRPIGHGIKGTWEDQEDSMKLAIVRARYCATVLLITLPIIALLILTTQIA